MAHPALTDDDDAAAQADKRATEDLKQKIAEAAKAQAEETATVVDLEPEERDQEQPEQTREPRHETRAERRANRYREAHERAEAAERRALEAERRIQELDRRIAELLQQKQQEPPKRPEADKSLDALYDEQEELARAANAVPVEQQTPEWRAEMRRKWRDITRRITRAEAIAELTPHIEEKLQQQRAAMLQHAEMSSILREYHDVFGNEDARQYAQGEYNRLRVLHKGRKSDEEVFKMAMEETRRVILKKGRPAPTEEQKAKYGGISQSRGDVETSERPGTVALTPAMKKMADAAYSHVKDQKERYRLWARSVLGQKQA